MKHHPVRAILNDTRHQAAVSREDVLYAAEVMPILFENGVRAMAIVAPKMPTTQLSVNSFQKKTTDSNVRLFTNRGKARSWIQSQIRQANPNSDYEYNQIVT